MCGIAGVWRWRGDRSEEALLSCAGRMADALLHRGPDSGGRWADAAAGLALGHRRLAIIDLSEAGHQPMMSACGRYVISYNGELYNTAQLRAPLQEKGRAFRGSSDTEVIVEACAEYGVGEAVRRLSGMFAIALWDRKERALYLVRDRIGIKPLYWAQFNDQFLFGSELKALSAAGGWAPEVDRAALSDFFRFGYIQNPKSIWRGVSKLAPGMIMRISNTGQITEDAYWSIFETAQNGVRTRENNKKSSEDLINELDETLSDSVARHMVSDVPIAAFLSGGVDSSLVTALMQKHQSRPVKTFSIGFEEEDYNEASHARAVAAHLKTEHTELTVTDSDARDVIPQLPEIYDEPFSDPSKIPTYLVSKLTRDHVTVALSGDGGDELYAGYERYRLGAAIHNKMSLAPGLLMNAAAASVNVMGPGAWNRLLKPLPGGAHHEAPGDKLHKLARIIGAGRRYVYRSMLTAWPDADRLVLGGAPDTGVHADDNAYQALPTFLDYMQYVDMAAYLPEDILTKVDRASMAVSLESRVPLLDHQVIEHAWGLPQDMKVRNGEAKWILKQALYKYVPRALIERPKMGFGAPVDHWLRGPLRDWAETLLDEKRLAEQGYLDPAPIRRCWKQHLSGERNMRYSLWTALMFQCWLDQQNAS